MPAMTTNADLTLIAVLVDRSGSMAQWREDMEGGLNAFVESQASEPGEAEITLAQFDTRYELVWPLGPIKDAPKYALMPRGGTALLDAMGRFITQVGEELTQRDEADRPGKVIVCIVTDGLENSSVISGSGSSSSWAPTSTRSRRARRSASPTGPPSPSTKPMPLTSTP